MTMLACASAISQQSLDAIKQLSYKLIVYLLPKGLGQSLPARGVLLVNVQCYLQIHQTG